MKEDGIHMNINKLNDLKVDMVFKNYKELVAFFDEEVKGGKGKTYQLENFKRYFDYEKQGNKFIITAIKDAPTEKKLRGKTATVGKELDALLTTALITDLTNENRHADSKNNDYFTYKQLYTKVLDIVKLEGNEVLFEVAFPHELSNYYNIDNKYFVSDYKGKMVRTLTGDLERSLNRLQANGIITVEEVARYVTDSNKVSAETLRGYDYENFLLFEKEVCHELNIKLFQKMNKNIKSDFDKKMHKYLHDYLSLDRSEKIDSCWKSLKITLADSAKYELIDAKSFNALMEQYTIELTKRLHKSCVDSAFKDVAFIADDFKERTIKNIGLYCDKLNEQLFTHIETSVLEVAI